MSVSTLGQHLNKRAGTPVPTATYYVLKDISQLVLEKKICKDCVLSLFCLEVGMWDLFILIPAHCLSVNFAKFPSHVGITSYW